MQPWAWAIVHGGKTVENRTQAWTYRGPLAIHAGARLSERGCNVVPDLLDATRPDLLPAYADLDLPYSAVIGTVDLVDVHRAATNLGDLTPCCDSPWAEHTYGGKSGLVHLVLDNPVPFATPIRDVKGKLGLWTPDPDLADAIDHHRKVRT